MSELSYQQGVLLVALELAKEHEGKKGYEFVIADGDLVLTPWNVIEGRGIVYFSALRVTQERILGRDETIVSELEVKLKEMNKSKKL